MRTLLRTLSLLVALSFIVSCTAACGEIERKPQRVEGGGAPGSLGASAGTFAHGIEDAGGNARPPILVLDDASGSRDCGPGPVQKLGCTEGETPIVLTLDGTRAEVADYSCSALVMADSEIKVVRLNACLSLPDDYCITDDETSYCAVVDLDASRLLSLTLPREIALEGTVTFAPSDQRYRVDPSMVTYAPNSPDPLVIRTWIEKRCFCSAVGGSQTLTGRLRIDQASTERVVGRLILRASGATLWSPEPDEMIEVQAAFDVAAQIVHPTSR